MDFHRLNIDSETIIGFDLKLNVWAAQKGKFSFLISGGEEGYAASYKDREYLGPQSSTFIMNGDSKEFKTFADAVSACRRKWQELRKS